LIGSNVLAGTWIISAFLRNFDKGYIKAFGPLNIEKSKNSVDISLMLGVGIPTLSIIIELVLYLRGERNDQERHEELMSNINKLREELVPFLRATKFILNDKKARAKKLFVNDKEISKESIDRKAFEELKFDKDEDRKYLK
jgi:hypothetical protein